MHEIELCSDVAAGSARMPPDLDMPLNNLSWIGRAPKTRGYDRVERTPFVSSFPFLQISTQETMLTSIYTSLL